MVSYAMAWFWSAVPSRVRAALELLLYIVNLPSELFFIGVGGGD